MEQVRARKWYLSLSLLSKAAQLCLVCLSVVPRVVSGLYL